MQALCRRHSSEQSQAGRAMGYQGLALLHYWLLPHHCPPPLPSPPTCPPTRPPPQTTALHAAPEMRALRHRAADHGACGGTEGPAKQPKGPVGAPCLGRVSREEIVVACRGRRCSSVSCGAVDARGWQGVGVGGGAGARHGGSSVSRLLRLRRLQQQAATKGIMRRGQQLRAALARAPMKALSPHCPNAKA